jgi:DNA-binding transcriptional LysR family regulator
LKDAVIEGNGVLLAHDVLAYDDLRTGRLVIPFNLTLRSSRSYYVVCAKRRQNPPNILAFRTWIKQEIFALDWKNGFRAGGP